MGKSGNKTIIQRAVGRPPFVTDVVVMYVGRVFPCRVIGFAGSPLRWDYRIISHNPILDILKTE